MTDRFSLHHRDGLWLVTKHSAPHRGGDITEVTLGQCRDRKTAVRVWLGCLTQGAGQ